MSLRMHDPSFLTIIHIDWLMFVNVDLFYLGEDYQVRYQISELESACDEILELFDLSFLFLLLIPSSLLL